MNSAPLKRATVVICRCRQAAAILCAIFMLVVAGRVLSSAASTGFGLGHSVLVSISVVIAVCLFAQHRWALRLAGSLCLLLCFVVPLGIINPFMASDLLGIEKELPSVQVALTWLLPLELLLLALACVLDSPACADQQ